MYLKPPPELPFLRSRRGRAPVAVSFYKMTCQPALMNRSEFGTTVWPKASDQMHVAGPHAVERDYDMMFESSQLAAVCLTEHTYVSLISTAKSASTLHLPPSYGS